MTTRGERIERLFHAAADMSDEERARFLASCGEDTELRRDVEGLLAADRAGDTRLDVSAPMSVSRDAESDRFVGRNLGPYLLVRRLGAGGMGAVYEASQRNPERAVAVKVLRHDVATPEIERRFDYEGRLLGKLKHPGIATVYEVGVAQLDGVRVPWIAMEMIDGARTVAEFARDQGLDVSERVALLAEVCDAVHYGHQRGVIHRDLKPANVLVDRSGQPKLIDFGVARAVDTEEVTSFTAAGTFLGTVQYMSPEQCRGSGDLDVRTDVYSLGVVLYELLCGRPPYELASVPLLQAARIVQETPPSRPSTTARGLRGDLETIVLTALEKDRVRRYQSAGAFSDDLHRYLRHEPIAARPPSSVYRLKLFVRRHKPFVAAVVVVFVAAIVSAWFAVHESRARRRADLRADAANIVAANLALQAQDAATARKRLSRIPSERRRWEWRYLYGQCDRSIGQLSGPAPSCDSVVVQDDLIASAWYGASNFVVLSKAGRVTASLPLTEAGAPTRLSFTPQGDVVWGSSRGELWIWRSGASRAQSLGVVHADVVSGVGCLPDGRIVSCSYDGSIRMRRPDGSTEALDTGAIAWRELALSADGARVAAGRDDGIVRVWNTVTGALEQEHRCHDRGLYALAFAPDGTSLATGSADATVCLWDLASGSLRHRFTGHGREVLDLLFLDGGALVSSSADRTIRVWDVVTGRQSSLLWGHDGAAKALAALGDARTVVSGGWDGTLRTWDALAPARPAMLGDHTGYVRDVAFSPDGQAVATASVDTTAKLIDPGDGSVRAVLQGHRARLTAVAFHPGGDTVATASIDGTVRLWDVEAHDLVRALEIAKEGVVALDYSLDGSMLAVGSKDGFARIHDSVSYEQLVSFEHDATVGQVAFDEHGGHLLTMAESPGSVSMWEVQSGRRVWRQEYGVRLQNVCFLPGGETFAAAAGELHGGNAAILLCRRSDGERVGELVGHTGHVLGLAVSPGGDRLASCSEDGTVRLWDWRQREELLTLRGHETHVWAVAFSPDGGWLASAAGHLGAGIGVRLWDGRLQ